MDKKNVVMYILAVVVIVALILAGNSLSKNRELRDKNDTLEAANIELNAQLAAKDEELSALQASSEQALAEAQADFDSQLAEKDQALTDAQAAAEASLAEVQKTYDEGLVEQEKALAEAQKAYQAALDEKDQAVASLQEEHAAELEKLQADCDAELAAKEQELIDLGTNHEAEIKALREEYEQLIEEASAGAAVMEPADEARLAQIVDAMVQTASEQKLLLSRLSAQTDEARAAFFERVLELINSAE